MKGIYIILGVIFIFFGCKIEQKDFILNSVGKEWRLSKRNNKPISPNNKVTLYLVFRKNKSYDIYYKRNGKRYEESTDNIIDQKWSFDNKGNLHIATFSVSNFKLIQLDSKNLVFKYGKEKYAFVCDECED
ncbi:MAG: hypothetical protein RL185_280 [Bacteroidota bacterium]|jgi:hypothetical protein